MEQFTKVAVLGAGTVLAGWIAWGVYVRRSTESVPSEQLRTVDGVEIRRYPETVFVETVAPDQRTGFRRLLSYIKGANTGDESVDTAPVESENGESIEMTAPVETQTGESIEMTAPVQSDADGAGMRMAFYLPAEYDAETAPEPTDSAVALRSESPRTMAVKRFSWFTPEWRVRRQERKLLSVLESEGIEPLDDPSLLRYNDPRTPPFMRRNEVAVEIPDDHGTRV